MARLQSIDLFRGLAIVFMVLANFLAEPAVVPAWLKHAPDAGLTVIDLIAPFFIFAIGLTYGASARRRIARDGWGAAAGHLVMRYLALIGIGSLLSAAEIFLWLNPGGVNWGVLQAIGIAGLVALPAIRLPAVWRAALGLVLLAGYQLALELGLRPVVLAMPHGGLPGAISWAAMLLLATALADFYFEGRPARYWLVSAACLGLGLGLAAAVLVISKNRVSAPYVLVSLGISALLFGLIDLWASRAASPAALPPTPRGLLLAWGRNPLLLYLLHELCLGLFYLPPVPAWNELAPAWLVVLQAAALLTILSFAAWRLRKVRFIL